MSLLLYIETNFIIALAKGQDEEGEYLINNLPLNLTLALPSICYMEALFVLQAERQRRHSFRQSLQIEINEAHRNSRSQQAQLALQSLRESLLNYESLLNEFNNKFIDIFNLLEKEIEIIDLKKGTIQKTLSVAILREEKEFRDDFILQCIINDARQKPNITKAFLSNNTKQFGKSEVQDALQEVGIIYFSKTQNLIGWLQSQGIS